MSGQLHGELTKALDECMIRDRFRFRKALFAKQNRTQLKNQILKSVSVAKERAARVPKPRFPEQLPVSQRLEDIKRAISRHQVVIVAGETGSGKTTQLPKICLSMGQGIFGVVGHTQPRRVAARTVAHRIAEELKVPFGESVGYQVRFTDRTSPHTHIKVMTDGILLAETQQDRFLEQYDTLIIDEAHERSLNIDFLLGYIKRILPKRPDLKVIITSATIDVERFSEHFSNAPVIEVSGRTYPVTVHYRSLTAASKTEDADELVYQGVLETLQEIAALEKKKKTPGDILVFLSGEREIRELARLIRRSGLNQFEVLPLYSRLSVSEQNRIFQRHKGRRIVLATNVAETSLTVPGIRYVIDPGYARISRYSVRSKVQQLPIEPISKASADQRKGRCGRISEGECFRLYSEEDFLSRSDFTHPEILRTNLAAVILQMLNLRLGDISKFPFVEKPEQRQINDGYHLLGELQAVDQSRRITQLGKDMARLPIDLRLGRMLLEAGKRGCLSEVLTIVSVLAIQDPRERPHEHQQASDQKHRQNWHEQSDFMALLKLWNFFESNRQELTNSQFRKFCRKNFLSYVRLLEWRENHRQLHLICQEMKIRENRQEADYASIHTALLSGLLGNIGEKVSENEYLGAGNRRHYIFPGSSQFKRKPKWIVSAELVETSRLFGRMVAQIDSNWIEPLASHLVKRTYHEPHFDSDKGRVLAYEEVMLYGIVIVRKRIIDFGTVDPARARQLFIQTGLVEQQLNSKAGFYRHNCKLVEEIEQLESKSRKRDILADSYTLFRFYDERLPENIVSTFELDSFRGGVEARQPKLLYIEKDTLMKRQPELSESLYPSRLKVADASLKLDYHFDPQHEDDGVSLNIPLAILRQVKKAQLDWVIPGLLEEKCLAMIKSLPKSLRKNFVPAPEYASKVSEQLEYDGRELSVVLAEKLFRLKGIRIIADDFNTESIDQHLRMNIRVIDEKGNSLATGRNLDNLVEQFADQVEQGFKKRGIHEIERSGLTAWEFGDLPEQIEFKQAGVVMKGYPALIDHGETIAIEILDNPTIAAEKSEWGLLRLLMLQLQDQKKYVQKNIPNFDQFALFYVTRGSRDELLEEMVEAIFRYTLVEDKIAVRTEAAFRERLSDKRNLLDTMNLVAKLVQDILEKSLNLQGMLKTRDQGDPAVIDIQAQLDLLVCKGFLKRVPLEWLRHYSRYFKAVEYRLEKLPGSREKDRQSTEVIRRLWAQLEDNEGLHDRGLQRYRWMIEELRVSLFAQPLGTSLPVSEKRLEKEWQQVANNH